VSDQVLTRDGPVSVPMDYQVPQGGELLPLMVRATMDGTSAADSFYAVVQVIAPSGRVMGTARFMLTHRREREHYRRTLDAVHERFEVRCGPINLG